MGSIDQEEVALELKKLVGWGAKHAFTKAPTLRRMIAERHPDADEKVLRQIIIKELQESVGFMAKAEAEAADALLVLSRRYEGWSAPRRREEAIMLLGLSTTWETFRREPELQFMRKIVQILVEKQNPDPKWVHYIHIRTEYEFDEAGALASLLRRMTFKSLIDGLGRWRSRSDLLTAPKGKAIYGCTMGEIAPESPHSDLVTMHIHFDELSAGDVHTVEYLLEGSRPKLLPDPWVNMFAGEQPIDVCVMAVRFKKAPRKVWPFNGAITPQAIPANRRPQHLEPDSHGFYEFDFTSPSRFFGIGWDW